MKLQPFFLFLSIILGFSSLAFSKKPKTTNPPREVPNSIPVQIEPAAPTTPQPEASKPANAIPEDSKSVVPKVEVSKPEPLRGEAEFLIGPGINFISDLDLASKNLADPSMIAQVAIKWYVIDLCEKNPKTGCAQLNVMGNLGTMFLSQSRLSFITLGVGAEGIYYPGQQRTVGISLRVSLNYAHVIAIGDKTVFGGTSPEVSFQRSHADTATLGLGPGLTFMPLSSRPQFHISISVFYERIFSNRGGLDLLLIPVGASYRF